MLAGPLLYGLPYRLATIRYRHAHEEGSIRGSVAAAGRLDYHGTMDPSPRFEPAAPGSLTTFLMERYSAFTQRGSRRRRFRVWQPPWAQAPARVEVNDGGLLAAFCPFLRRCRPSGASYSPGLKGVWIGWPRLL